MMNHDKQSNTSSDCTQANHARESSGNASASESTPIAGQCFPKQLRLSGRDEFAKVFDQGQVAVDQTLVIHAIRTERQHTRIGLSISKKVGSSPTRNYWKRCIREAFRLQRAQLPGGMDVVIRPRRDAKPDSKYIASSLSRLLKKLDRQLANS